MAIKKISELDERTTLTDNDSILVADQYRTTVGALVEKTKESFDTEIDSSSTNAPTSKAVASYITSQKGSANGIATLDSSGLLLATQYALSHNIPRMTPKDITSYYEDGTLWDRIAGTNGYSEFEDVFVGDYIKMSRPISAYEQTQILQETGSQYVTIAGINTLWGNGFDDNAVVYNHLVMVPGQGFGGIQHFGRSRMNSNNTTIGGYYNSEMNLKTLGVVTTTGSTASTATINEQLYAEFGSHLKTVREVLSNSVNTAGYNRFGTASGCSNNWSWYNCQAVLMSEIEIYGSIVWSSSGYDTGTANHQLPLFAYSTQAQGNQSSYYWLKDVASSSKFCRSDVAGIAATYEVNFANIYVRPRFIIA